MEPQKVGSTESKSTHMLFSTAPPTSSVTLMGLLTSLSLSFLSGKTEMLSTLPDPLMVRTL